MKQEPELFWGARLAPA